LSTETSSPIDVQGKNLHMKFEKGVKKAIVSMVWAI
jgi:hypothetical protein